MKKILKKIYYNIKKKKLKNDNFTIISNNCFGGIIYKNFGIQYKSPTCGLFFFANDYIKFIYNLKKYINIEMKEITIEESKYCDYLKKMQYDKPIGRIDDVEVFFLHYNTYDEALEKWERRKKRIVWNNIIYKFNDQNLCNYSDLEKFDEFNAEKKILFTAKKYKNINSIQLKQFEKYDNVLSDTNLKDYRKYIDIINFINE